MRSLLALPLLLLPLTAGANVPAAYLACDGKVEGDPCRLVGPSYGSCVRDTLCEDTAEIEADECLLCVDPCWGKLDGDPCLRTIDNSPGVCELQDRCTDKPETSFLECNRCVEGRVASTEPDEGCSFTAQREGLALVWGLILLAAFRQWRRR